MEKCVIKVDEKQEQALGVLGIRFIMKHHIVEVSEDQKTALKLLGFFIEPLSERDSLLLFNPYKEGDLVRLKVDVKDIHGKIWHDKEDVVQVSSVEEQPYGTYLVFKSSLKANYLNVEKYEADK